jgi:hypothetical protein
MTPLGIKPATLRLVAQCLNQMRYRVPPILVLYRYETWSVLLRMGKVVQGTRTSNIQF